MVMVNLICLGFLAAFDFHANIKILHSVTDVNVCLGIKYHDSSALHR